MDEIMTSSGGINYTALLIMYDSMPSDEQKKFLQMMEWEDHSQLHGFRNESLQATGRLDGSPESLQDYAGYRMHKMILLYVPPVLILIGVVGNLLSFVVLSRPCMRRVSAYLYLSVLSMADTLVLFVGLLRLWAAQLTGYDVQDSSEASCKLIGVLGSAVSDYAVWLIIAVTVERYVAVCHPLKAPAFCGRRRAVFVILGLIAFQLIVNGHFLWTTRLQYTTNNDSSSSSSPNGSISQGTLIKNCQASPGYEKLINSVWPWVDTLMYSFIPFISILIFNTLIIQKVIEAKRMRTTMCANGTSSPAAVFSTSNSTSSNRTQDCGTRLSIMLLTVSFAFLLMTLPMNLVLIGITLNQGQAKMSYRTGATFTLLRTLAEMLMYANHSTNFFLYCATGLKFRKELCRVVCRRGRRESACRSLPMSSHYIAIRMTAVDAKAAV